MSARASVAEMLTAIGRGEKTLDSPGDTLLKAVAEAAFQRHEWLWKPRTIVVNRSYLRNRIMPHFAGRQIVRIDRQEVRN